MQIYSKMIRKWFGITLIVALLLSVAACCEKIIPEIEAQRSVLIYMAANNNLDRYAKRNLELLKSGFLPSNGNIIVYLHLTDEPPRIFKLVKDKKTNTVEEELIKEYDINERSTDPAVLTRSLQLMEDLYPAKEYGLILWSHGTGWLPVTTTRNFPLSLKNVLENQERMSVRDMPVAKSFSGYRGDPGMDVTEIAAAIPYRLSFILFDACLMGGIEVLYALRDVTDYMIASPAEILADGFPYDRIMQPLFLSQPDLKEVCNAFFNFYDEQPGQSRSATVALYATEWLPELTQSLQTIFSARREEIDQFSPVDVQSYANYSLADQPYFDLNDFIYQLAPAEYTSFKSSLDKVVLHSRATERVFSMLPFSATFPIKEGGFGGISTYIPHSQSSWIAAYKETEWNKVVHLVE